MAAHVADLAVMLTVMVGPDPRDPGVVKRGAVDYTTALNPKALDGARFGLVRDFMDLDPTADAVTARAADTLRAQGAEVIDMVLPRMLVGLLQGAYETIRDSEFPHEIDRYLATLPDPALPKTHADIIRLSELLLKTPQPGLTPNPARLEAYKREAQTGGLHDQPYRAAVNDARKIVQDILSAILERERLNALVGPTSRPARLIAEESAPSWPGWRTLAAMTGWPELSVPVGFTSDTVLPIGLSFLGPPFSEPQLLSYGHALQRALPPRRLPQATPRLSGERFDYRVTSRKYGHE
jgi:amidase